MGRPKKVNMENTPMDDKKKEILARLEAEAYPEREQPKEEKLLDGYVDDIEDYSRVSREFESRSANEERVQHFIDKITQTYKESFKDPLYIDPKSIPAGYVVMWARETIRGRKDDSNLRDLQNNLGWSFAPATMFPDHSCYDDYGNADESAGLCRKGGSVLMIREKTIHDAHMQILQKQRDRTQDMNSQIRSMDGDMHPFATKRNDRGHNFFPSNPVQDSWARQF